MATISKVFLSSTAYYINPITYYMKQRFLSITLILFTLSGVLLSACKKKENENPKPDNNQNPGGVSLLSGAQTGAAFTTGSINDFTLASNGSNVALVFASNSAGKIYVIDIKDNDASQAAANAVTTPVADFKTKIAASLGGNASQISFINVEVNPVSRAIYVLARNTQANAVGLFKVTNGGNTVSSVNLQNTTYSTITFSTAGHIINDMTWGDNKLYISFAQPSTLNGEIAVIPAPFAHNTTATSRATTVFKSNWGGNYFTDAPLETMTYGEVDGEKRLMGVTVCAPGFSFKTSEISQGSGLLQVKEYYNLNTGIAQKVFCVTQGQTTYMVEVHEDGRIARVGEKYLNESLSPNAMNRFIISYNGGGPAPANGLTDEDLKIIAQPGTYVMASKYSDTKLLVIKGSGELSLLDI